MGIDEDMNGRKVVTTSIREMVALVASIVALLVGAVSLLGIVATAAVSQHRLTTTEAEVAQVKVAIDKDKTEDSHRTAEVAVIKSQLDEIRDQNRRILEKINQL